MPAVLNNFQKVRERILVLSFLKLPLCIASRLQLRIAINSLRLFLLIIGLSGLAHASVTTVPSGGDLQGAIDIAQCGDTIVLEAGGTYLVSMLEQPFVGKAKGPCTGTSADFITIQGSNFASLPASFRDLSPAQINALNLPKLVTRVSTPALEFEAGSHHYRFVGIEITNDSVNQTQLNNGLVFVGENSGSQSASPASARSGSQDKPTRFLQMQF